MKTKTIHFVKEFTDCPGGRSRIDGEFSGEEFRKDFLEPALAEFDRIILDLNGVFSFPPSFIDEAFGVLVDERGLEFVREHLALKLDDSSVALEAINEAMQGHAA